MILFVTIPLIMALAILSGPCLAMWETWWLLPAWALVAPPLGLPQIDYWHLFALNLFVSVLWVPPDLADYAKDPDKTTRNAGRISRVVATFLRPVVAFYVIRWVL